jgi:hypothetical protein
MDIFQNISTVRSGLAFLLLLCVGISSAQNRSDVYVDKNGVMRWENSKTEVFGFGVNYTVPFAHAYRAAKILNVSLEKAIDDDVYHFARLGLDAYRVHVWDVEISDSAGNLLENEHLHLFDYLLKKLKDRGIKSILTPIAFTGSGYPESDEKQSGFTSYYGGKANCLVNPDAIKAEERYLTMFLNHVNPYTGIAYKNDPDIIAFEICNEPHHKGTVEETKTFINRLAKAMRSTGCKKPIFYNMSHSVHLADAYINSDVQGGTFQWYPSGLVGNQEVKGNFLPHVDKYPIPFANDPKFKKMAKIVYEVDAADIGRSYIYPAMARSFREAGIQFATHFAWDPNFLAYANTSYQTHYMNLAYAPQKALSLKIASEVFHKIPMYKSFGRYPANNSFDVFKVDYENDLAEMVSEKKFIYTNNTTSTPPSPQNLEEVAGFGNSLVVKYEGLGAYFLDKLEEGVWRLEVMPDAIWVRDPFERANFQKEVTVINWKQWPITIDLPDLSENFSVNGLNDRNNIKIISSGKTFAISPGAYLLTKKGATANLKKDDKWKNIKLNEFVAPPASTKRIHVLHIPAKEISAGDKYKVNARVISANEPDWVQLFVFGRRFQPSLLTMKKTNGYDYSAIIPDSLTQEGYLNYYISVKENGNITTYPSEVSGQPTNWDYFDKNSYRVPVVSKSSPVYFFNAIDDIDQMTRHFSSIYAGRKWVSDSYLSPGEEGKAELILNVEKLFVEDPEYKTREKIYDCTFSQYAGKKIFERKNDLTAMTKFVFRGHAPGEKSCKIQLALVMKDGSAYGGIITVGKNLQDYNLLLTDLKPVKYVLMPRPYPTFLPYYFDNNSTSKFNLSEVESLQFSIGPGIPESELNDKHAIGVESVRLQ